MKTLKTTFTTTTYFLIALLIAFTYSCDAEDGLDGAPGEQGVAGQDGQDGQDGNANVQTLTIDATGFAGTFDDVAIPEITQDVIDNDAILAYLTNNGSSWISIPSPYDSSFLEFSVHVATSLGFMSLDYNNASGSAFSVTAGDLQALKVIIIKSTTSRMSEPTDIYTQLENANININDYYAVCDYFGITY